MFIKLKMFSTIKQTIVVAGIEHAPHHTIIGIPIYRLRVIPLHIKTLYLNGLFDFENFLLKKRIIQICFDEI